MEQPSGALGAPSTTDSSEQSRGGEFHEAVVLITGAGSGLGQCSALEFARHGCQKLLLADMSMSKLETTKSLIADNGLKPRLELYEGNVSDEASTRHMIKRCVDVFGRLDIALNSAGVSGGVARTSDVSMQDFDFVCAVNERGVFLCEKYELEQMLSQEPSFGGQRGAIVNIASIAGHCIIPGAPAYAASKHAVVAISRCDALRHAQDKIRINCISPGPIWTPMISEGGLPKEFIEFGALMAPMHRYGQPIEVANAVLFLAGPKASAITGINLPVDCGTALLRSI